MKTDFSLALQERVSGVGKEYPLTVRQAAKFFGLRPQTNPRAEVMNVF